MTIRSHQPEAAPTPYTAESLADRILQHALDHAAARLTPEASPILRVVPAIPMLRLTSLLKRGQAEAHEHLRYGAALHIAEILKELDGTVRAVYILDAEDVTVPAVAPLNLIVVAERKTPALASLLQDLDEELTRRYRALVGARAEHLVSLLTAAVVDERDVQERRGWAAQLFARLQPRPILLWSVDRRDGRRPA